MKKTIFFTDKFITFSDSPLENYDLTIDSRADTIAEISRAKVIDFFEKYNSILFLCNTPEQAYSEFYHSFRRKKAAGGVVTNDNKETLMIFRNSRWDLPKGHLERNETIEECAVREVQEETGITGIELGDKIIETQHAYILNEEWVVKTTYWYSMKSQCQKTICQTEEGIECAKWCSQAEVVENLETTYPTIKIVFEAINK